jgi:pimeloyl-ACP methyl ester carboxylesterase
MWSIKQRGVVAGVAAGVLATGLAMAGVAHAADNTDKAVTAKPTVVDVARAATKAGSAKPTIVLAYGAFEDGSAWAGVTQRLQHDGYQVVVPALPMRGLASDVAYLNSVVATIPGPVVLGGHSWGGMVISEAAAEHPSQVKALAYIAAFTPKAGESAGQLDMQFPGSLLGPDTTVTKTAPDGTDLYVKPESYHALFAGDRSAADAAASAAEQRPLEASALAEPALHTAPASIPAYAVVATQDKAIPPAAERFMAKRAGAHTIEIRAAHDVTVTHPGAVADLLEQAARGR